MTVTINVKHDIKAAIKEIEGIERQIPFAASRAINWTLKDMRMILRKETEKVFDRPTRMTRQFDYIIAHKKKTANKPGEIGVKDFIGKGGATPEQWLAAQIKGGRRKHKRHEAAYRMRARLSTGEWLLPTKYAPLNKHGNMTGAEMVRILSQTKGFSEQGYLANETARSQARNKAKARKRYVWIEQKGKLKGVYQVKGRRKGRKVIPILLAATNVQYRPRFDFYGVGGEVARSAFPQNMRASIKLILADKKQRALKAEIERQAKLLER